MISISDNLPPCFSSMKIFRKSKKKYCIFNKIKLIKKNYLQRTLKLYNLNCRICLESQKNIKRKEKFLPNFNKIMIRFLHIFTINNFPKIHLIFKTFHQFLLKKILPILKQKIKCKKNITRMETNQPKLMLLKSKMKAI